MSSTAISRPRSSPPAKGGPRWRTVDIVVASVLAVAFGVVFWAWGDLWNWSSPAFAGFPPAQALMYGVWLLPGVLGGLVIRKPGAALYTELVASVVEALLGSTWGLQTIVYGLFEGLAPELVFYLLSYRYWRLPSALTAGALAGATAAGLDLAYYYAAWPSGWMTVYTVIVTVSSALVAGLGSWALVRSMARTGVLAPFPSGREQELV